MNKKQLLKLAVLLTLVLVTVCSLCGCGPSTEDIDASLQGFWTHKNPGAISHLPATEIEFSNGLFSGTRATVKGLLTTNYNYHPISGTYDVLEEGILLTFTEGKWVYDGEDFTQIMLDYHYNSDSGTLALSYEGTNLYQD